MELPKFSSNQTDQKKIEILEGKYNFNQETHRNGLQQTVSIGTFTIRNTNSQ